MLMFQSIAFSPVSLLKINLHVFRVIQVDL